MRLGKAVQELTKAKEEEEGPGVDIGQAPSKATSNRGKAREERIENTTTLDGACAGADDDLSNLTPVQISGPADDLLSSFKESVTCPTCKGRPCLNCGGVGKIIGLVGYLLREARAKLTPKLEQKKMAELLGISSAYLSVLERGDKRFPEQLAVEYVRVLVENGWKAGEREEEIAARGR